MDRTATSQRLCIKCVFTFLLWNELYAVCLRFFSYFSFTLLILTGFVQNLKILESPWIWKQKFKGLKILEFIKKCLKSLNCSCFSGYILKLFCNFSKLILFMSYTGQNCLKFIKVAVWIVWRHFLLISNAFFSAFSPWISWYMTLKSPWKVLEFNSSWPGRTLF